MKIEKINDRQIRCTLTREDLADRKLKISELAYGTDKAKALFQDMMQVAAQDFGFEADNAPLVIEAVPISMDTIILIITKVEDPEELDTRFSRFSPEDSVHETGLSFADIKDRIEGADDILGLIRKISEAKKHAMQAQQEAEVPAADAASDDDEELRNLTRFYMFHSLDDAIRVSGILGPICDSPNSLYKDPETGHYFLFLQKADSSAEQFNKVCNVLTEYALACKFAPGTEAHFAEHMDVILSASALQTLAQLK